MAARPLCPAVLLAALAAACSPGPKAPPLTDEAVYDNPAAGLRFLAPAGWAIQSRANPPPGPLAKPVVLVSYQQAGAPRPAELTVLAADLPADASAEALLVDYRVGAESWAAHPPARELTVNGVPATRYLLTHTQGKDEIRREVTAFRRGGRAYFFLVTFAAADAPVRDAVRTTIDSITWTK
jgi:hypothetical protein